MSTSSRREKSTVGAASTSWSRPSSRLITFVTRATGSPPREPLPLAARHEKIADLDLVARVDHLDLAGVALRVARAADEAARVGALVLDVDAERRVDRELHVHRVARDVEHLADDAVRRDDRHVRADVARPPVEDDARDAEELGLKSLPTTCALTRLGGIGLSELEEAAEALVLGLLLLEAVHLLAKARVVVGEALVVGLHVDEVDVVAPDVRDPAREARRAVLDRRRDAEHGAVERVLVLRVLHVRREHEERDGEEHDDDARRRGSA